MEIGTKSTGKAGTDTYLSNQRFSQNPKVSKSRRQSLDHHCPNVNPCIGIFLLVVDNSVRPTILPRRHRHRRPGQKATGYLEVPGGVDPAANIPVVVVNGAKPGKVLALVSGAH